MHEIKIKIKYEFNGKQERIDGSVYSRGEKGETQLSYYLEKSNKQHFIGSLSWNFR